MFLHDKSLIILRLQGTAKIIQRVHMIVNFSSVHKTGKRWVFIPIGKKDNAKECSNCHITTFISHASKVMLKILQVSLQQYVKRELPDVQTRFRKGRGTRDQIVNICWIIEKAREFQKNIYFCFIDYIKAFGCVDTTNWKILKEMGNPDNLTYLLRNLYAGQEATVRTRHWNNGLVQNWERSACRLYIVTLLIQLIYKVHHA